MKYNNIKFLFCGSLLLLVGGVSFTSCTDWLDKDPESMVAEDEAFKNYRNFQGYIEEIYDKIPDKEKIDWCTSWNLGDDAVHNSTSDGYRHMDHQVDLGNYRNVWNNGTWYVNGNRSSLWTNSWYCIRKCNLGIENIKSLVGTDEERNLLLGQMYFFRAWWHFELMCYFGGLPYVDKAYEADEIPQLKRLSFQKCAERCAEDFQMAANLLPNDAAGWDATLAGMQTSTKNDLRINKFMALCYLGKCYLYAASPLMKEFEKYSNGGTAQLLGGSQGANPKTYDYDIKYAKLAAEWLGKALDMVNRGTVSYKLAEYKYSNIYDHVKDDNSSSNYSDIFYTYKQDWLQPGSTEAIFRGLSPDGNTSNWNCSKIFGPKERKIVGHDVIIHHPTANLIDQYGMANGEPIYLVKNGEYVLNPTSGWDPEHPYKNRDPRFYHDIIFDGFHYVLQPNGFSAEQNELIYCPLYTGGLERKVDTGSSTGYFIQKLIPHQCNEGDKWYDAWGGGGPFHCYLPYMRLADVYLMYAEARAAMAIAENSVSIFKDKPDYCPSLSALDAIDVLHDRVNSTDWPLERVPAKFYTTPRDFMDVVRRERAVELSFEGFRWNDLQRWLLLTEAPYTVKYSHEFERVEKDDWYYDSKTFEPKNDPKDAKVANFRKKELITRHLESKHYWFPLPDKDTYLYHGFDQNPGW